jgi:hypothetical protein
MRRLALGLTIGLFGLAAVASADAIQKWRVPDGSLYFGDHPPPGSTLIATYPDTASPPAVPAEMASLSQAAADGRDIIRRREAERAAEHRVDEEREARQAELAAQPSYDYGPPFWFITSTAIPCRSGDSCFDHSGHRHRKDVQHDHGSLSHSGGFQVPDRLAGDAFRPPVRRPAVQASRPSSRDRFPR